MLCLEGQALAVAEQLEYELEGAQSFTQVWKHSSILLELFRA